MKKILYYAIGFLLLLFLSYIFYFQPNIEKIKSDIFLEKSIQLRSFFVEEIRRKQDNTGNMVYLLSKSEKLINALKNNNKSLINYKEILEFLYENGDYKNLWLQIVDKNGISFYRSWSDLTNDNILDTRRDLIELLKDPKPSQNISSGLFDLTLKTIQPIFDENGTFLGFIEFISKFNSIAISLKNEKIEPVFILSKEKSKKLTEPFSKLFIKDFYIANENADKEILALVEKVGVENFVDIENYSIIKNYLVTNIEIKDTEGNDMGLFLMFFDTKRLDNTQLITFKNLYLTSTIIFSLMYSVIFLYLLKSIYAKKLDSEIKLKTKRIEIQSEKLVKLVNIYDRNVIFSRTDKRGIITHASSAFARISGYSKEELVGKPHNIVRHPDMPKEIFKHMWSELKNEKPIKVEIKNLRKDGSYYWVIADLEPEYDDNGKHIGYFAVREDITANKDIEELQREIIFTMGSIAESRSKETGEHVKRVAKYSRILALKYGLNNKDANILELASPMHDIGKIAIPDSILNKPAKLTPEEFKIMKTHAEKGFDMLNVSSRPLFQTAAQIALTHHEKYDGTGYPYGLKGDEIPIFGRITALADVFDAIGSDRCYKKAWPLDEVLEFIKEQSGKHFDPKLVEIFFENLDEILEIKSRHKDLV